MKTPLTADFSPETIMARKQWDDILHPTKLSLNNEGKNNNAKARGVYY